MDATSQEASCIGKLCRLDSHEKPMQSPIYESDMVSIDSNVHIPSSAAPISVIR